MALDLSALMENSNDNSNLDILINKNQSGELIFDKLFGSRTLFKTKNNGSLVITFIFDPNASYTDSHQLVSCLDGDLFDHIRVELTKHLLKDKVKSKRPTLDEHIIMKMSSLLSKDTFNKLVNSSNMLQDNNDDYLSLNSGFFIKYIKYLEDNVRLSYEEDELLLNKINKEKINFTYNLGIDSYPNSNNLNNISGSKFNVKKKHSSNELKRQKSDFADNNNHIFNSLNKKGVLMINIKTRPDIPVDQDERLPQLSINNHSKNDKQKKEFNNIIDNLKINLDDFNNPKTSKFVKEIPETSTDLFDQIAAWFYNTLQQESERILNKNNKNSLMYN